MADRLENLSLTIDPLLTALAVGYTMPALIGTDVMPIARVASDRGTVADWTGNVGIRKISNTLLALRAEPNDVEFDVSTKNVLLEDHALKSGYSPREVAVGGAVGIDVASRAVEAAKIGVLVAREKAVADIVQSAATTSYAAGNSETVAGGSGWNELTAGVSNVDPIDKLVTAQEVVRGKIGIRPNQLVMGATAWNAFAANTKIKDRAKVYGIGSSVQTLTRAVAESMLKEIGITRVFIGESNYWSGSAFVDCWGDFAALHYVDPNPRPEVGSSTWGYTLCRQYGMIDGMAVLGVAGQWKKSDWVSYGWYQEQRLVWAALPTAGYLMLDVVK